MAELNCSNALLIHSKSIKYSLNTLTITWMRNKYITCHSYAMFHLPNKKLQAKLCKFAHTNSFKDWPPKSKPSKSNSVSKQGIFYITHVLAFPILFLLIPSPTKLSAHLETSLLSFQSFCSVTTCIRYLVRQYGPLNHSPRRTANHYPCRNTGQEIKDSFCSTAKDRNCFSKN